MQLVVKAIDDALTFRNYYTNELAEILACDLLWSVFSLPLPFSFSSPLPYSSPSLLSLTPLPLSSPSFLSLHKLLSHSFSYYLC